MVSVQVAIEASPWKSLARRRLTCSGDHRSISFVDT